MKVYFKVHGRNADEIAAEAERVAREFFGTEEDTYLEYDVTQQTALTGMGEVAMSSWRASVEAECLRYPRNP